MRCIDGENELILTCETQAEGVCILRCETRDPVVLLPDEIDGAPVTALGRYVLSGRAPDLSGRDTFSVRVTCGGPLPVHEADSIRAVTLPKQLKTVGSYAFYNCRSLEELTMTDSVSAFDGGSLMNCLSLHRIRLLAPPGGATCRKYSARPRVSWMCAFCTAMRARRCCSRPTPRSSRISARRISFSAVSTAPGTATASALTARR